MAAGKKAQLEGKIVSGGRVITVAGQRYTFAGKEKQWAIKNVGKDVKFELDLTADNSPAGGPATLVKARRGEKYIS